MPTNPFSLSFHSCVLVLFQDIIAAEFIDLIKERQTFKSVQMRQSHCVVSG
jgi:hypothetical protein